MKKSVMRVLEASGGGREAPSSAAVATLRVSQFCFDGSLSPHSNKIRVEKSDPGLGLSPPCPLVLRMEASPLGMLGTYVLYHVQSCMTSSVTQNL